MAFSNFFLLYRRNRFRLVPGIEGSCTSERNSPIDIDIDIPTSSSLAIVSPCWVRYMDNRVLEGETPRVAIATPG